MKKVVIGVLVMILYVIVSGVLFVLVGANIRIRAETAFITTFLFTYSAFGLAGARIMTVRFATREERKQPVSFESFACYVAFAMWGPMSTIMAITEKK